MSKFKFSILGVSLFLLGSSSLNNICSAKDVKVEKLCAEKSLDNVEQKKIKEIELVFIIDMSGSMSGQEDKVLKGFKDMLEEQKTCDDGRNVNLTTVVFNTQVKTLHNGADIKGISGLTESDYQPNGCTALLDAVGNTVKSINDSGKDKYVICVVITDGYENSSYRFSQQQIKGLIKEKESQGNWKFLYYMSGIELNEKTNIGIRKDDCMRCASALEDANIGEKIMKNASLRMADTRARLR